MEFECGANAIFSSRQFTGNALTPWGGNAKSKRETFAQCNIRCRFLVRFGSVWVWSGLLWLNGFWLGFHGIVSVARSEHFNRL